VSARTERELAQESAAWRTTSAMQLRTWAELMVAKAERAREAADVLDPPRRRRRRKTRPPEPPPPELEQVARIGKSLDALREGARRAGVTIGPPKE